MKWRELIELAGQDTVEETESSFSILSTDSRTVYHPRETLFFAIKSNKQDGHDFIPELCKRGVRHFVIEKSIDSSNLPECRILQVPSSIQLLQHLARVHRLKNNIPIIAITGSNGKTTTKEWISTLIADDLQVVKSPKSFNSQIGVPFSVWQIEAHHEVGIFEAGISKPGEMERLAEVLQPTIGILTNIGAAHDEGFRSRHEKLHEKTHLFKSCEKIICCKDHSDIYDHLSHLAPEKLITWSKTNPDAHYYLEKVTDEYILYRSGQAILHFNLPFELEIWVENALHAIIATLWMGIEPGAIESRLDQLRPVGMRLTMKPGVNQCTLVDDSYNNDLVALQSALEFCRQQAPSRHKILILSDFEESGQSSEVLFRSVNTLALQFGFDELVGIGPEIRAFGDFEIKSKCYGSVDDFLAQPIEFRDALILVKGARRFGLDRIARFYEMQHHRTLLEINLEAIKSNLDVYRSKLNRDTKMMVMIKAFAYGGGIVRIGQLLQYHNVDYLGVAYADEALLLRKNGIHIPIMVMNAEVSEFEELADLDVEVEIFDFHQLDYIIQQDIDIKIHLKLDTGMTRLGFQSRDISKLVAMLSNHPQLDICAVMTHLSSSELTSEDEFTIHQIESFQQGYEQIATTIGRRPIRHILNSSGIVRFSDHQYEMVRLGIGLYGHDPTGVVSLQKISTLKARVSQVKTVPEGSSIGYGRAGKAKAQKKIAVVSVGYADGYSRALGNGVGRMLIRGSLVPTVGNICMDMTMVDVTGLEASIGDEVVVFGQNPTLEEVSQWGGMIPYEMLTGIGPRVTRVYLSE